MGQAQANYFLSHDTGHSQHYMNIPKMVTQSTPTNPALVIADTNFTAVPIQIEQDPKEDVMSSSTQHKAKSSMQSERNQLMMNLEAHQNMQEVLSR